MSEEHATIEGNNNGAVTRATALCSVGECTQHATHSYTWDWGEAGYCCSTHLVTLRHRMQSLDRVCTFVALQPGAPTELAHDERVQLHARVLAAEDEVKIAKARNLVLFQSNETLTVEVRRLHAEAEELRSQVADARAEAEQLTTEKMKALADLADSNHELARLQGLLAAVDQAP